MKNLLKLPVDLIFFHKMVNTDFRSRLSSDILLIAEGEQKRALILPLNLFTRWAGGASSPGAITICRCIRGNRDGEKGELEAKNTEKPTPLNLCICTYSESRLHRRPT